jgi:hypothetical protein
MLLLVDKSNHPGEAAQIIKALDRSDPKAEARAEKLAFLALLEASRLTEQEKAAISEIVPSDLADAQTRSENIILRVTPSEKAVIRSLATAHGVSLTRLILDALEQTYNAGPSE